MYVCLACQTLLPKESLASETSMYVCMLSRFRNVTMYSTHVHTVAIHWLASGAVPFPDGRTITKLEAQAIVLLYWPTSSAVTLQSKSRKPGELELEMDVR